MGFAQFHFLEVRPPFVPATPLYLSTPRELLLPALHLQGHGSPFHTPAVHHRHGAVVIVPNAYLGDSDRTRKTNRDRCWDRARPHVLWVGGVHASIHECVRGCRIAAFGRAHGNRIGKNLHQLSHSVVDLYLREPRDHVLPVTPHAIPNRQQLQMQSACRFTLCRAHANIIRAHAAPFGGRDGLRERVSLRRSVFLYRNPAARGGLAMAGVGSRCIGARWSAPR